MQRILITGSNGFVANHLAEMLNGLCDEIHGLSKSTSSNNDNLDEYFSVDLSNADGVRNQNLAQYDTIFSLAGLSRVGESFDNTELYEKVNVDVLKNIATPLVEQHWKGKIIAVSTGAVYSSEQSMPLHESSTLNKEGSPYSLSKIMMEECAKDYAAKGLNIIIARPMNHIGPHQAEGFLLPDMYKRLLLPNQELHTGNVDTKRDYTDVRDVAKAYIALAESESIEPGEVFNVCSGKSTSGREIIEILANKMGLPIPKIVIDQSKIRPTDPQELYGDYSKLKQATGWVPTISLEQSIEDFVQSAKT